MLTLTDPTSHLQIEHLQLCQILSASLASRPPELSVRRSPRGSQMSAGWADPNERLVVVYWHPLWSWTGVRLTHLHELLHLSGKPGCATHSTRFKRLLIRGAEAAWGVNLGEARDHRELARYSLDDLERVLLRRLVVKECLNSVVPKFRNRPETSLQPETGSDDH